MHGAHNAQYTVHSARFGPVFKRLAFDSLIQGAQEVSCTVDQKSGDIVLTFESCQMNEGSHFVWKRNYKEITDFSKGEIRTEGNV